MSLVHVSATPVENRSDSPLFDELLCIADSKFILGSWYFITLPNGRAVSDWTALCAMLQNHYGHARALYRYLSRFGFTREEAEWRRKAQGIRSLKLLDRAPESWVDFVVSTYLVEQAVKLRLDTIAVADGDQTLARLIAKVGKETRFHLAYAEGWLKALSGSLASQIEESIAKRYPEILDWWGGSQNSDPLFERGQRSQSDAELLQRYQAELAAVFAELNVKLSEAPARSSEDWRRDIRRSGPAGIPDKLFELVRFRNPELAVP